MNLIPLIRCQLNRRKGLTFVELLVVLSVSAIVLAAVATLAYAMATANNTADDTSRKQAQVRYATRKISELLRHGKLIGYVDGDMLLVWRADDNENDQINTRELTFIEALPAGNILHLKTYPTAPPQHVFTVAELGDGTAISWLNNNATARNTTLVTDCSSVVFVLDSAPPNTRFASVEFDVVVSGITRHYQITGTLRCYSGS